MKANCISFLLCTILLFCSCTEVDSVQIDDPVQAEPYDSVQVLSVKLLADGNDGVIKDVYSTISGNTIILSSPYIVDPHNITLQIITDGGGRFYWR